MKNCTLKKYDGNADVYFDIICKWMDVMYDENNKEKIKNILIDEFNIVEEDSEIISNALLTIRIGVVTRRYLFTEYKDISKDLIRKQSIKE